MCRATGRDNLFEVVTPSRTFFVQVDTKDDMKDWVAIFQQLLHTVKPLSSPPAVVSGNNDYGGRERERERGREGETDISEAVYVHTLDVSNLFPFSALLR